MKFLYCLTFLMATFSTASAACVNSMGDSYCAAVEGICIYNPATRNECQKTCGMCGASDDTVVEVVKEENPACVNSMGDSYCAAVEGICIYNPATRNECQKTCGMCGASDDTVVEVVKEENQTSDPTSNPTDIPTVDDGAACANSSGDSDCADVIKERDSTKIAHDTCVTSLNSKTSEYHHSQTQLTTCNNNLLTSSATIAEHLEDIDECNTQLGVEKANVQTMTDEYNDANAAYQEATALAIQCNVDLAAKEVERSTAQAGSDQCTGDLNAQSGQMAELSSALTMRTAAETACKTSLVDAQNAHAGLVAGLQSCSSQISITVQDSLAYKALYDECERNIVSRNAAAELCASDLVASKDQVATLQAEVSACSETSGALGIANGKIMSLESEVSICKATRSSLETDLGVKIGSISEFEGEVSSLKQELATANTNHQVCLTNLENASGVVASDSECGQFLATMTKERDTWKSRFDYSKLDKTSFEYSIDRFPLPEEASVGASAVCTGQYSTVTVFGGILFGVIFGAAIARMTTKSSSLSYKLLDEEI